MRHVPNTGHFATAVREAERALHEYRYSPRDIYFPQLSEKQVGQLASKLRWIAQRSGKEALITYLSEQFDRYSKGLELQT